MQIGKLAKEIGVTVQTVRFYERRGLMPQPPRRESGYRDYGEGDLRRLEFIRHARGLGFSLEEIREILRTRERGQCPCTDVSKMAERHLADAEAEIARLQRFRRELRQALGRWKQKPTRNLPANAICVLIERTMNGGRNHGRKKSA